MQILRQAKVLLCGARISLVLKDSTIVLKFGGSSVADPECIRRISRIAIKEAEKHNVIVVVSAMGKTTNSLIALANQACEEPRGRELDMLLATGELVSISVTAMTMQGLGHPAVSMTGWQAGFVTEPSHNKARIAKIKTERIQKHLERGEIVVVAGFQGVTEEGEVTTLGRGGSDTSAVALAAAFNVSVVISIQMLRVSILLTLVSSLKLLSLITSATKRWLSLLALVLKFCTLVLLNLRRNTILI